MSARYDRKVLKSNNDNKIDHQDKLYDVVFRHDGNTMILFRGLTRDTANVRIQALKQFYTDWRGDLFKIRSNLRNIRNASKKKK